MFFHLYSFFIYLFTVNPAKGFFSSFLSPELPAILQHEHFPRICGTNQSEAIIFLSR
jgi:hypothetical protein